MVASSPMDRRPTRGSAIPKRSVANAQPIWANWTSIGAVQSTLAPESIRTVGAAARHRDDGGDGRAGDAVEAAHAQQSAGHGCTGVASAHHGARSAVAHGFSAAHERGVPLHPYGATGVFVHPDDLLVAASRTRRRRRGKVLQVGSVAY